MKNRILGAAILAGMMAGGAPLQAVQATPKAPPPVVSSRRQRLLDMMAKALGGKREANYIKRPRHTNAEMQRKARKARNVRRHRMAMKRRGRHV